MQPENDSEPTILALLRVLFTTKMSKTTTSSTFLGLLILVTVMGIFFGIILLTYPVNKEIVIHNYGSIQSCRAESGSTQICDVSFTIANDLEAPVYIYYQIENFIANSKDYITSRNHKQLMGSPLTYNEASRCKPYITNRQMEVTKSWGGYNLNPDDVASPCGLQAKLYFRDSFLLLNSTGSELPLRTDRLLNMFMREPRSEQVQWVDPTTDSFAVWMTTSVSPTLEKIYGVIDEAIPKGNYTFRIHNKMNYGPDVEKNVMLYKQNNEFGDSRLIGSLILGGSFMLLFLILLYSFCICGLCKCPIRK